MNEQQIIFVMIVIAIYVIRMEIKINGVEKGKHYILYDGKAPVSRISSDGSLEHNIAGRRRMTYQQAMGIKKLYPHLRMMDARKNKEIVE